MIAFPHAKINIGLHITGRRTDGYHEIETLMLPVSLCDALEIVEENPENEDVFSHSGIAIPDNGQPNLCMQAAKALRAAVSSQAVKMNQDGNASMAAGGMPADTKFPQEIPPLKIHLHKRIPVGAGLGGGSSDAAFTLRMIQKMYGDGWKQPEGTVKKPGLKPAGTDPAALAGLAALLGSDCPFFLSDAPMLARGRGEILEPFSLPQLKGMHILLVVPPIHISTAGAYADVRPVHPPIPLRELLSHPIETWKENLANDFESVIFPREPAIRDIRDRLYEAGAVYASMSGSGSGVYGIFRLNPLQDLPVFPGCFVWSGQATP